MPLKPGYSKHTISANVSELFTAGKSRESAIFVAYAMARAAWFERYPAGHLPYELRYPKSATRRHDYDPQGRPFDLVDKSRSNSNPIAPELAQSARDYWKLKPGERFAPAGELKRAERLYRGFTGKPAKTLKKIAVPNLPKTALAIGKVIGIIYSVDATGERFRHEFKSKARPLLVISSDGRQVFLLGGAFTFTDRGFVDRA